MIVGWCAVQSDLDEKQPNTSLSRAGDGIRSYLDSFWLISSITDRYQAAELFQIAKECPNAFWDHLSHKVSQWTKYAEIRTQGFSKLHQRVDILVPESQAATFTCILTPYSKRFLKFELIFEICLAEKCDMKLSDWLRFPAQNFWNRPKPFKIWSQKVRRQRS